jgi:hypothetical protein
MALDVYVQEDIKRVLASVFVAQRPGQEGCRALVAVALAFGCIDLPAQDEPPQVTARALLIDGNRRGRVHYG